MPLFEKYWIEFSPPRFKLIVNPGQRQVIVSNKSLTLFNSTSVWVKNSSEGCHVTSVPLPFTPLPEVLFSKTPSLKVINSYWSSLQVLTLSQWLKNVVILLPIPKEPREVPS